MYNRYMDGTFSPLNTGASPHAPEPGRQDPAQQSHPTRSGDLLGEMTGGISRLLGGVFKQFSLEDLDTGDILLVLIILFLFLEGDNLELVITLGLMLLFGLKDDQSTE